MTVVTAVKGCFEPLLDAEFELEAARSMTLIPPISSTANKEWMRKETSFGLSKCKIFALYPSIADVEVNNTGVGWRVTSEQSGRCSGDSCDRKSEVGEYEDSKRHSIAREEIGNGYRPKTPFRYHSGEKSDVEGEERDDFCGGNPRAQSKGVSFCSGKSDRSSCRCPKLTSYHEACQRSSNVSVYNGHLERVFRHPLLPSKSSVEEVRS